MRSHRSQPRRHRGGRPGTGGSRSSASSRWSAPAPSAGRNSIRRRTRSGPRRRASPRSTRRCVKDQVELRYYRVDAPQSGVVGDIAVRTGDRVTPQTVITTIDENEALEAYIEVPLDRAPDLRVGLPVELLDENGKPAATNPITFVAPRVEEGTQAVLAKVLLKNAPPRMRVQQFVPRAHDLAHRAGADDPDRRGQSPQRPVLLFRGRTAGTGPGRAPACRCRSERCRGTTTWSAAASSPAIRSSCRACRRLATAPRSNPNKPRMAEGRARSRRAIKRLQ